eukprot:3340837-Rhodomonas_salina.1
MKLPSMRRAATPRSDLSRHSTLYTCGCDEGYYITATELDTISKRRLLNGDSSCENFSCEKCEAGFYCPGGLADGTSCTAPQGFYCPKGWTPIADADANPTTRRDSVDPAEAGRPCPPNMFCAGNTTQPVALPLLCDLAQSCGPLLEANDTCAVKQSTFYKYNDPAADVAVDGDDSTCMKTATADTDANP